MSVVGLELSSEESWVLTSMGGLLLEFCIPSIKPDISSSCVRGQEVVAFVCCILIEEEVGPQGQDQQRRDGHGLIAAF